MIRIQLPSPYPDPPHWLYLIRGFLALHCSGIFCVENFNLGFTIIVSRPGITHRIALNSCWQFCPCRRTQSRPKNGEQHRQSITVYRMEAGPSRMRSSAAAGDDRFSLSDSDTNKFLARPADSLFSEYPEPKRMRF